MKFACACGNVIRDQTDYQPHKAHLISDQDLFEALEISDTRSREWFPSLTRALYECRRCGRLWLEANGDDLIAFIPEKHSGPVLAPAAGNRWKAPLRGQWLDKPIPPGAPRGVLFCLLGNQEQTSTFDDWSELERAYQQTLESRRSAGTLRDAMLTKNGKLLHVWPDGGNHVADKPSSES